MNKRNFCRMSVCLALCLALTSGLTAPACAAAFTDVPQGYWAGEAISRCVSLGYFKGETATRFGVGHAMTRGAFVVVLGRFFGWESSQSSRTLYDDVPAQSWCASAVQAAYEHGAITLQEENFRPGDPITREEMAVMLVRALGYGPIAGLAQDDALPFQDVTTNAGYIAMAYALGLVNGTAKTTFSPERTATREQTAVILMRLYDKLHQDSPAKIGILTSGEDMADMTGFDAVAVSAARLVGAAAPRAVSDVEAEEEAAMIAAARDSGAKVLLRVSGSATVLKAKPADAAAELEKAMEEGEYDGIYLDLEQPEENPTTALTALAAAVRQKIGDKLLYVAVESPQRQQNAGSYTALGQTTDFLVMKVNTFVQADEEFSTAPVDPLEEVYYGLKTLAAQVEGEKLCLQLTTTATLWQEGKQQEEITGAQAQDLAAKGETYYSNRYACAYAQVRDMARETSVIWYLDSQAVSARVQLAGCFGVGSICLSTLQSPGTQLLAALA